MGTQVRGAALASMEREGFSRAPTGRKNLPFGELREASK